MKLLGVLTGERSGSFELGAGALYMAGWILGASYFWLALAAYALSVVVLTIGSRGDEDRKRARFAVALVSVAFVLPALLMLGWSKFELIERDRFRSSMNHARLCQVVRCPAPVDEAAPELIVVDGEVGREKGRGREDRQSDGCGEYYPERTRDEFGHGLLGSAMVGMVGRSTARHGVAPASGDGPVERLAPDVPMRKGSSIRESGSE